MQKVIVIGCPGSGKSTFSRALHEITYLPLFHLDMLFWKPDKTTVERSVFLGLLTELLQKDAWIIDGNYNSTLELRVNACDTVIFLDYPVETCLEGIRKRRGKPRPDMPWVEAEEDTDFLEFIKSFQAQHKPKILEMLQKYAHKNIHIFKTRSQADAFLSQIKG